MFSALTPLARERSFLQRDKMMERDDGLNVSLMYDRDGSRRSNPFARIWLRRLMRRAGNMKDRRKEADEFAETQVLDKISSANVESDDDDTREMPVLSSEDIERVLNKSKK